ncbi:hypothetical protein C7J88_00035 [Staphylococcus muscae]|nr:hypothetical protein C7J88_00035 [Staphylococcus muscae]PNZ05017.1 hypothetical protein CD131_03380 [Staphylococcus muscae]
MSYFHYTKWEWDRNLYYYKRFRRPTPARVTRSEKSFQKRIFTSDTYCHYTYIYTQKEGTEHYVSASLVQNTIYEFFIDIYTEYMTILLKE